MSVELLRLANRQKVADALTAQGYSVTRMTVNRWAGGSEMPTIAARMICELFGHAPDTKEAPPPQWARGLVDEVLAAVQAFSAESALERIVDRLAARLELLLLPDDADAHEAGGAPPGAERTRPLPRA